MSLPTRICFVMDPIESIKPWKDSSFAMMLEAQQRGWQIHYCQMHELYVNNGKLFIHAHRLCVTDQNKHWFEIIEDQHLAVEALDIIMMRKDPPFDSHYIACTYLLDLAEKAGVLVANKPESLRNCNEKLYTTHFPQCCVDFVVTQQKSIMLEFIEMHQDIIIKPLYGMGGESIFRIRRGDGNTSVILESVSQHFNQQVMLQKFIPEINLGDKRILLINGKPIPYALARIPQGGDNRGNLAAGGKGIAQPISARDQWICEQISEDLQKRGLYFAGIDIIGDYLTEINVTSPTCIRELDDQCNINISNTLLDHLEQISPSL